jgi:mono/diheme cytochrome c family protein
MKKLSLISFLIAAIVVVVSCNDVKRTPGRDYMPDMRYSRAYETYTEQGNLAARGIHYNGMPVPGTIRRGETFPFSIPKDNFGDTVNYYASRQVPNPLPLLNNLQFTETERLYLINCGICHGTKLDGNGPLYNGGSGPYPAAPRNLVDDPKTLSMPDGQMFYSITYGYGQMGPYGPQLTTTQRWQIVHYIRAKQGMAKGATTSGGDSTATTGAAANNAAGSGATNGQAAPKAAM